MSKVDALARAKELASEKVLNLLALIAWTGEPALANGRPAVLCYPPEEWGDDEVYIIEDQAGLVIASTGRFEMPLAQWEEFLNIAKGVGKP